MNSVLHGGDTYRKEVVFHLSALMVYTTITRSIDFLYKLTSLLVVMADHTIEAW